MLIEFITEIGKKATHFGDGKFKRRNSNSNDSYSYLQKNDLKYINCINQAPKGASNFQGIAQLLRSIEKLKTIINIKSNFHHY